MKTYRGSGGIESRILNLGITWIWMVSFMPRLLYPRRKSPRYLKRRLGVPQNRSGHFGVEINVLPLPGFEPRTTQLIAWPVYTDYAIPALTRWIQGCVEASRHKTWWIDRKKYR